jgi:hypothetical protein
VAAVRAAAAEALGNLGAALAMRARLDGEGGVSRGLAIQLERITSCLQLALAPTVGVSYAVSLHARMQDNVHH